MQFADTSETITASWVDQAVTVYNRIYEVPEARDIIARADQEFLTDSPLDSLSKLQVVVSKSRTEDVIIWSLASIYDYWKHGSRAEPLTWRMLAGAKMKTGFLDLAMYKFEMKKYFMTSWLETMTWGEALKTLFRQTLATHQKYRAWNGSARCPVEELTLIWRESGTAFVSIQNCWHNGEEHR